MPSVVSSLALLAASLIGISAVELFHVTTHISDKKNDQIYEKLFFSICLNEDVVDVVADEFIDLAQSISPEYSELSEEVVRLKDLICNEHTREVHQDMCKKEKPSKFVDPVNPFSSVTLGDKSYRISVREGQTAESLTDCFCTKNTCSYHQGKYIEDAIATKISNAKETPSKEKINIKRPSKSSN